MTPQANIAINLVSKRIAEARQCADLMELMAITLDAVQISERYENGYMDAIVRPAIMNLAQSQMFNNIIEAGEEARGFILAMDAMQQIDRIKAANVLLTEKMQETEAREMMKSAIFKASRTATA